MVIRDGKRKNIDIKDVVLGDIVILLTSDKIPVDGTLLEGEILVNEAILIGEEVALIKKPATETNLFMGTMILSGKDTMRTQTIGLKTEMGKIGKGLIEIEEGKTPIQKNWKNCQKNWQ